MISTSARHCSHRLQFDPYVEQDAAALANLLADPDITRNITADGSSPERCQAYAKKRIRWYNSYWESKGYGVWAVRIRPPDSRSQFHLAGWCGFIPPDGDEPDPEILYALGKNFRGSGYATEAARHAINWLFNHTEYAGVSAIISSTLNPESINVVEKLGLRYHNRMNFTEFLPDSELARDVLGYEIWRLQYGSSSDPDTLIFQTAFRVGQLIEVSGRPVNEVQCDLLKALEMRKDGNQDDMNANRCLLLESLQTGLKQSWMERYFISRDQWQIL